MFDTRSYIVEFTDGTVDAYMANVIAENIYCQVDKERRSYMLLDEILDHRKTQSAVEKEGGYLIKPSGAKIPKKTTTGWEPLICWKGGASEWLPLRDIKNSYPLEAADYVQANKLIEELAFKWWVPRVLRQRRRMVDKVIKSKTKYWRTTHKFGIKVPESVKEALQFDAEMGPDCHF